MEAIAIAVLIITAAVFLRRYRRQHQTLDAMGVKPADPTLRPGSTAPFRESKLPPGTVTVAVSHVDKSFNGNHAVNDVSFEVRSGEILGMVGPNGAGKTTTIRMLMDIIKADSGTITILGEPLQESTKNRIGYLPEERGLYRKITVAESMDYMAQLKGLAPDEARRARDAWLRRVGMSQHQAKKVEQLSKGMGQLIQFAGTLVHDPELIVLDEPFSGLDPVNRETLKHLIVQLRDRGRTIMLSTHQMNEVEELCDRVLMINQGRVVLYGELGEIRERYRNNSVFLEYRGSLDGLAGLASMKDHGRYVELFLTPETSPQEMLRELLARGIAIDRFEVSTPSLHEIFIKVARGEESPTPMITGATKDKTATAN